MGKNRKTPTFAEIRSGVRKEVRVAVEAEPGSPNERRPVWQFAVMDLDGPFGWEAIDAAKWWEIRHKLAEYEHRTWQEILQNTSHKSHPISVSSLSVVAQERLKDLKIDDVSEVFSLRLTGPNRIFGIRVRETFRILWWDPDHLVCPANLRHT